MKFTALSILLALVSGTAVADTYTFTKANNKVTWHAEATPGFLRIDSSAVGAEGALTAAGGKVSGTLTVTLSDYDTGIDERNEHMKNKYLEVAKFPKATLVLKDQAYVDGKEGTMTGALTLKGDTKPVSITFTVTGKKISAKFKLSLKDYPSVGAPSFKLVSVGDEVEVSVDGSL